WLEVAGDAGVQGGLQAQVALEEEQVVRREVVVQDVVQRLAVERDVDLRDVSVPGDGTGQEKVEQALSGSGVEGRGRARKGVQDARQVERQGLAVLGRARRGEVLGGGGERRKVEDRPSLAGVAIRGQREERILGSGNRERPLPPVLGPGFE